MTDYDPRTLTRLERLTMAALEQLRSPEDRIITCDTVMRTMETMGWKPPKLGLMLTLRRMKSIAVKGGDNSIITSQYRRGRGHSAQFNLKGKTSDQEG